MDRINANANRSIEFMYQGKPGGVEKNTADDVLTRKIGNMDGKPVAIFERAGNKNIWQKFRNAVTANHFANAQDVKDFLIQRGISKKAAATLVHDITMPSGAISARGFEELLQ
jgi:hypothetical protein